MSNTESAPKTPPAAREFNYCFWSKLIVAIPAIPLVGIMAALAFSDTTSQIAAAIAAIALVIWLAVKIDQLPCLASKVVKRSH